MLLLTAFKAPLAAPQLRAEAAVSNYSEQTVYEALIALKSNQKYAPGARYDNNYPYSDNSPYVWEAARLRCAGCAAFAAELSDAVFGKSMPVRTYQNISEARPGDVLRYQLKTGEHTVIVLRRLSDSVEVAEGNYSGYVYWGRTVSFSELQSSKRYFYTRYPEMNARGDTDGNGVVSAEDAQLVLKAYTRRVSGQSIGLTQEQTEQCHQRRGCTVDSHLLYAEYRFRTECFLGTAAAVERYRSAVARGPHSVFF